MKKEKRGGGAEDYPMHIVWKVVEEFQVPVIECLKLCQNVEFYVDSD